MKQLGLGGGREFQARAAATGKARSSIVVRRVSGKSVKRGGDVEKDGVGLEDQS